MGVGGPWRVSMGCMDELMDKNLPYFVGGNLTTLLHTSWPKTKLQSVGSDSGPDLLNVLVDGNPVDLVESFTYLGSIQTSDSDRYCRSDITRRIGLASSAMSSLNNIWNTKHLSIQTKVRVYQTLVLSSVNPAISIRNMDLACQ